VPGQKPLGTVFNLLPSFLTLQQQQPTTTTDNKQQQQREQQQLTRLIKQSGWPSFCWALT